MKKLLFAVQVLLMWSAYLMADEHSEKLDKLIKEFDEIGMFSGRVLLAKDGSVIFDKTCAFADWEKKTPVTKETLFRILKQGGVKELSAQLKTLITENGMEYDDGHLNFFGYELMNSQELPAAIEVFKLNSELFPDVPNVFDSLGEAYMNAGNNEQSILNYKKALEMDESNDNAKKMLEILEKQKQIL